MIMVCLWTNGFSYLVLMTLLFIKILFLNLFLFEIDHHFCFFKRNRVFEKSMFFKITILVKNGRIVCQGWLLRGGIDPVFFSFKKNQNKTKNFRFAFPCVDPHAFKWKGKKSSNVKGNVLYVAPLSVTCHMCGEESAAAAGILGRKGFGTPAINTSTSVRSFQRKYLGGLFCNKYGKWLPPVGPAMETLVDHLLAPRAEEAGGRLWWSGWGWGVCSWGAGCVCWPVLL